MGAPSPRPLCLRDLPHSCVVCNFEEKPKSAEKETKHSCFYRGKKREKYPQKRCFLQVLPVEPAALHPQTEPSTEDGGLSSLCPRVWSPTPRPPPQGWHLLSVFVRARSPPRSISGTRETSISSDGDSTRAFMQERLPGGSCPTHAHIDAATSSSRNTGRAVEASPLLAARREGVSSETLKLLVLAEAVPAWGGAGRL